MNSKEFINTLRKVIREEVQTAVRNELNNILNEGKVANAQPKMQATKQSYTSTVKKQYVKNSMLNDILNETTSHRGNGPMAMMEEEINYNDLSEWPTMRQGTRPGISAKSVLPTTDLEGRPVNVQALPDEVVNALTKDYSALMKAIDKKKGK